MAAIVEMAQGGIVPTGKTDSLQRREVQWRQWLIAQLMTLAMARRAADVGAKTLELFAERLSQYDQRDIVSMVNRLSYQERADGELAFPDLARLDREVRDERNKRMRSEREQREREEAAAEERRRREHPEEFAPFDFAGELAKIKARKGEMTPPPVPRRRPSLSNPADIQHLTPQQLRELADLLERQGSRRDAGAHQDRE